MIRFQQDLQPEKEIGVNMLPLVDIIFNLLIFFLITATISSKGINLDLPRSETAKAVPAKIQEIVLNEKGEIFFNEVRISLSRLEKILSGKAGSAAGNSAEKILLSADKKVPFGRFITVMDTVRKTGCDNLIIATKATIEE